MTNKRIKIPTDEGNIILSVDYDVGNLNMHVKDSYYIKSKKDIKKALSKIMEDDIYILYMIPNGYTRSLNSLYREWAAHNLLYKCNYKADRVKDVDLNQNEPLLRRIGYFILSLFYRG